MASLTKTVKVLCVDDSPLARAAVLAVLSPLPGVKVHVGDDPASALRLATAAMALEEPFSFFILAMFTFVAPAIFPGSTQLWFIIMFVFIICSVIFIKNTVNLFHSKKILLTLIMITDGYLTDFRFKSFSGYTCNLYSSNPPECYKIDCSRNNRRYCLSILVIKKDSNIKPVD